MNEEKNSFEWKSVSQLDNSMNEGANPMLNLKYKIVDSLNETGVISLIGENVIHEALKII